MTVTIGCIGRSIYWGGFGVRTVWRKERFMCYFTNRSIPDEKINWEEFFGYLAGNLKKKIGAITTQLPQPI